MHLHVLRELKILFYIFQLLFNDLESKGINLFKRALIQRTTACYVSVTDGIKGKPKICRSSFRFWHTELNKTWLTIPAYMGQC